MSTAPDLASLRPTRAEIDLGAFERNIDAVVAKLPPNVRLIAALKADAYGHGAVALAKRCRADRVAMIAVALLEEALDLRRAGISLPLFVLGPLTMEQIAIALDHDITIGVVGPEELGDVCRVARARDVSIHLKLDSGMGRMGVVEPELDAVATMIKETPRLRVEALYTHFANAGNANDPYTEQQVARFDALVRSLQERGIDPPHHHLANSAATMRGVIGDGDFVRVGIALYGGESLDSVWERPLSAAPLSAAESGRRHTVSKLEPVMRWRTEIMRLKELPAGSAVGYGTTFHTKRVSRIATLPVGYADGYDRLLSNKGEVLVRGRRAPVVGRVSMDLVTIDVTDVEDAAVGDEVVLLGAQGEERITAEELAEKIGTISYEVLCNVSARVPRAYSDGTVRSKFLA